MTQLINVLNNENPLNYCRELEKGNILFFQKMPFSLPLEELEFLLSQSPSSSISLDPDSNRMENLMKGIDANRLKSILENYSSKAVDFLSQLLPAYSSRWKRERILFKKGEPAGSEKLHLDACASRPIHGWRVLRFFTNIHPIEKKGWVTSKLFSEILQEFTKKGLPFPKPCGYSFGRRLERKMKELFVSGGLKMALRSPYDQFMIRLQRFLNQNIELQESDEKTSWSFPPGSCWALLTDQLSHAALSGFHLLEQVLLIPNQAMLYPDRSPVSILERLTHKNMTDPAYEKA